MAHEKPDPHPHQPMIRFGDEWVPAHEIWNKMETATVVVDTIDHFNQEFPDLASADTRNVVPLVRKRLKDIQLRMPTKGEPPDLQSIAADLLTSMPPEDVIQYLAERYGAKLDLHQLIQLAGEQDYLKALGREAAEFEMNRISPEQMAELWNGAGRPAPGGGLWNAKKVAGLMAGDA
jgi:hypothetical protein